MEHVKIQDKDKTATIGGTSWRYIKRLFLEDGRETERRSEFAELAGYATHPTWLINLVTCWYLRQKKLREAGKSIYMYLVCGVCGVCEREVLEHALCACYVYVHCLISEQANKIGRSRIVR